MIQGEEMTNDDQLTLHHVVLLTADWFALDELSYLVIGMESLLVLVRIRQRHTQPAFTLRLFAMEHVTVFDLFSIVWN